MFIRSKTPIATLRWFDILMVTLIMTGQGIYVSTLQYAALVQQTTTVAQNVTFSSAQNYEALLNQGVWLVLAILYLWLRRFDFSVLLKHIRITPHLIWQAPLAFVAGALALDAWTMAIYRLQAQSFVYPSMIQALSRADFSLVLYALFNGFYEEVFFLGICLAVKPRYTVWAFLYSLLIRISFHTYQGLTTAIGLGLMLGTAFFLLYQKFRPKNMLPFFLAHAFADVVGLTILSHIWY